MMKRILETPNDIALTIGRIFLGGVLFAHGAQLALGWFGGKGFSGTLQGFTGPGMGIPVPLAVIAILTLFLAPIALMLGFLARPAA
ncbi:DoxX family protein, partial [bacterium]